MVDIAEFNRSMILHLTQRIDGIEKKIDSQENRSRKLKKEIESVSNILYSHLKVTADENTRVDA